jgi:endonuclease III
VVTDVADALGRVREAIRPFPKAAMFDLRDRGYGAVWQQLVACVLSIRTTDEVSGPLSIRLFERAPTPEALAAMSEDELATLIRSSSFAERKAPQILAVARAAVERGGDLEPTSEALTAFHGVGPKCAHLALGVARGLPYISVDVHVHRVTNRWGYVQTRDPLGTLAALEERLPKEFWVEINSLLVPFGKHVCTGVAPRCSTCPLNDVCPKIGVGKRR